MIGPISSSCSAIGPFVLPCSVIGPVAPMCSAIGPPSPGCSVIGLFARSEEERGRQSLNRAMLLEQEGARNGWRDAAAKTRALNEYTEAAEVCLTHDFCCFLGLSLMINV